MKHRVFSSAQLYGKLLCMSQYKYVCINWLYSFAMCERLFLFSRFFSSFFHFHSPLPLRILRMLKRFSSKHLASVNKREYYEMNLKYLLFCIRKKNFFLRAKNYFFLSLKCSRRRFFFPLLFLAHLIFSASYLFSRLLFLLILFSVCVCA